MHIHLKNTGTPIQQRSYYKRRQLNYIDMQSIYNASPEKVVIGMVGLPARGKSYISKKIYRFLNWLGFNAQVFNVGNYRRKYMIDHDIQLTSDFFDYDNHQFYEMREMIAQMCLDDLINYINTEENKVAIFDGTNTNKKRRKRIAEELQAKVKCKYQLIWIESICNKQEIIQENIYKVKVNGQDYKSKSMEEAQIDFRERIKYYEKVYETLTADQGYPFIKTINVGEGIEINKINGYLAEKIMTYTINLTISPKRKIYLSRHGESQYNIEDRIGGNSKLSEKGERYASTLPIALDQLIKDQQERENLTILTSTLKRTIQTARYIKINNKSPIQLRILDEINAGICENLTYKEIFERHPEIFKERENEKLSFRYPSGESYIDAIGRLEPLIYWIQRQKHSVLVIGHQAIIRCISAYFFNFDLKALPYIPVPLHILIKLTPEDYTFSEQYVSVCLQTGKILEITKAPKKKFSIDMDGSENSKKKKFKSVKSMMVK